MRNYPIFTIPAAMVLLGFSSRMAQADYVLSANIDMISAIQEGFTPPPMAVRNLAILHTAIYDSANGIAGAYVPCYVSPAAASGASAEAAVAAATHRVMNTLYGGSAVRWDKNFEDRINGLPENQSRADGVAWGYLVADTILASRSSDGAATAGSISWTGGTGVGEWRPTPPGNASGLYPLWGDVTPFGITNTASFLPAGPPAVSSSLYATEYNETLSLGSLTSSTRTADQTQIASFWADGPGTETPPGHWNSIARDVLPSSNSLVENARAFAALNVAMADAGIVGWDAKYEYNFWRPITAIQNGDADGNALTAGDGAWLPLLNTPPFPEYVSGHSSFSGAASVVLAHLMGTDSVSFSTDSDALGSGIVRNFTSFSAAAAEAGQSRIYGGIHFQSANQDGLALGAEVGNFIMANHFGAVPEPSSVILGLVTVFGLGLRRTRVRV